MRPQHGARCATPWLQFEAALFEQTTNLGQLPQRRRAGGRDRLRTSGGSGRHRAGAADCAGQRTDFLQALWVPVKYPDPSVFPSCRATTGAGKRSLPAPVPCWPGCPPTMCCCTATRAPASPARSRPSPTTLHPEGLRLVEVKKEPALPDPGPDGQTGREPSQVHPVHRRLRLYRQRRQLCRPQGHSGGQRGRQSQQHCDLRHLQPPPPNIRRP